VRFFDRIASRADRPVFYNNNPGASGVTLSLPQWRELLAHPKLAGVKNSAGQLRVRKELQRMRDERAFLLFEGDEWAVDEALALGHDGTLVGLGLLGARLFPALAAAAGRGDGAAARKIQMDLIDVFHAVYGEDTRFWCVGQKYALARMGLFRSSVTLLDDQRSLPEANRRAIDELIDRRADWFPKV
jgi:dihydrodipicolinate synthase/N-acetylneuraminate lyase